MSQPIEGSEELLFDIANLFKVLGDTTRIRIISALDGVELCVQDMERILSMRQSAISHQLRELKQARLVKFRKHGKNIFYTLDDAHIGEIFKIAAEHVKERTIK